MAYSAWLTVATFDILLLLLLISEIKRLTGKSPGYDRFVSFFFFIFNLPARTSTDDAAVNPITVLNKQTNRQTNIHRTYVIKPAMQ